MEVFQMRNKYLSYLFAAMSILLSNVMCVTTAYNYCSMQWCEQYAGCSAPASVAFLLIIPCAFAIVVCAVRSWFFHQRFRKSVKY